jgi:hypothetical protein
VAARCLGAVLRLDQWDVSVVTFLKANHPGEIIPWFDQGNGFEPIGVGIPNVQIIAGFGRTDGKPTEPIETLDVEYLPIK